MSLVQAKGFEPSRVSTIDFESTLSAIPSRLQIGADKGTRTLMISHWNLNPACLPISPYPQMVPMNGFEPLCILLRMILSHLCLPFHHIGIKLRLGFDEVTQHILYFLIASFSYLIWCQVSPASFEGRLLPIEGY